MAATAVGPRGLESVFSNEVNYKPALPPSAPALQPPVTLVVQSKAPSAGATWADAGMNWSLSPAQEGQLFRLMIMSTATAPAPTVASSAQAKAIAELRKTMGPQMPPIPK